MKKSETYEIYNFVQHCTVLTSYYETYDMYILHFHTTMILRPISCRQTISNATRSAVCASPNSCIIYSQYAQTFKFVKTWSKASMVR